MSDGLREKLTKMAKRWRTERAHTYASENAEHYRGFDAGRQRSAEDLLAVLTAHPATAGPSELRDALRERFLKVLEAFGHDIDDPETYAEINLAIAEAFATAGPSVAGNYEGTFAQFTRRAGVLIEEEQAKPLPDNALISFLCDAIRIAREAVAATAGEGEWREAAIRLARRDEAQWWYDYFLGKPQSGKLGIERLREPEERLAALTPRRGGEQLGYCDKHRWLHEKDSGPTPPCRNWQPEPSSQGEQAKTLPTIGQENVHE